MNVVIDTSVAIAWYVKESFSKPARVWHEKILAEEVHAWVPSLHYLEFANVLRTYVRRGEMSADLASDLYALHVDAPLETADPPRAAILDMALAYDATAYDAAFIALALSVEGVLITAERAGTPWVVKLGKQAVPIAGM